MKTSYERANLSWITCSKLWPLVIRLILSMVLSSRLDKIIRKLLSSIGNSFKGHGWYSKQILLWSIAVFCCQAAWLRQIVYFECGDLLWFRKRQDAFVCQIDRLPDDSREPAAPPVGAGFLNEAGRVKGAVGEEPHTVRPLLLHRFLGLSSGGWIGKPPEAVLHQHSLFHTVQAQRSSSHPLPRPAPACCWKTMFPWSRFRSGSGTAISARPPTSTPTWRRTPRPARRTPCSAPWALKRWEIRAQNKKKAKQHMSLGRMWRRGWDSNPCAVSDKLISSRGRYDRFDTSPKSISTSSLGKRRELMERTAHDPILGAPCKPSKIKALRRFDSTFRIRFRVNRYTRKIRENDGR